MITAMAIPSQRMVMLVGSGLVTRGQSNLRTMKHSVASVDIHTQPCVPSLLHFL